jgi:uncharacterized protein
MSAYLSPGVYVSEVEKGAKPIAGVGTAVAAFVGFTAKVPDEDDRLPDDPDAVRPRLVTSWSQYTRLFGEFTEDALLPHAVYGYFNNGGGIAYIVRLPEGAADEGDQGGDDGPATITVPAAGREGVDSIEIEAQAPDLEIEFPEPSDEEADAGEPGGGGGAPATFDLIVRQGGEEKESHENLVLARDAERFVERVVNRDSRLVRVVVPSASGVPLAERLPAPGSHRLPDPGGGGGARSPAMVDRGAIEGSEDTRTGIRGLTIADDVTMIAVPDLATAARRNGELDLELYQGVQAKLIEHCERVGNRMAILDAPPGLGPQSVKGWREDQAMYDSRFAVLYYPWIDVDNPLPGGDATVTVPPCGHVAGVWARSDQQRGVWKAPANEVVRGARNVAKVTRNEQDLLNPIGVNCIRPFGTRGIRIWGARTLSSDANWQYVNVRRLFNFLQESIDRGTQWVVFEPNGRDLWQRVNRTLRAFLTGLWAQGALAGGTPDEAFFVKCDEENNPPDQQAQGILRVEVGVAPLFPAEFVVIEISQWQGAALAGS